MHSCIILGVVPIQDQSGPMGSISHRYVLQVLWECLVRWVPQSSVNKFIVSNWVGGEIDYKLLNIDRLQILRTVPRHWSLTDFCRQDQDSVYDQDGPWKGCLLRSRFWVQMPKSHSCIMTLESLLLTLF